MRRLAAALLALATATPYAQPGPAAPEDPAGKIAAYDGFRPHTLLSWHPVRREMLVRRRAEGIDTLHWLTEPGATPPPLAKPLGPEHERADSGTWNPKGDRFAFFADHAGRTALHVVDPLRPGSDRVLATLEGGEWSGLRYSGDGRRLVALERLAADEAHLWIFDAASGRRQRATRTAKGETVAYGPAYFSRDGRSLFTTSDRGSEHRRLIELTLADGRERVLTSHHAYDVEGLAVSFEAERIAFITNESGSHVLRFLDTRSLKEQPRPALFDGVIGGLEWRRGSREIGFHITSARSAGDVFSYDEKENRFTRWTNGNNPAVNTRDLAEPRIVKWLTFDGRQVTGLHYHPRAPFAGRRPVIVSLAEPGSQARAGFIGRDNYLVSELGIAMIFPSFRGASGFGKSFARLDPADAAKDLEALREWIRAQPDLDSGKVFVRPAHMPFEEALAAVRRDLLP